MLNGNIAKAGRFNLSAVHKVFGKIAFHEVGKRFFILFFILRGVIFHKHRAYVVQAR